MPDPPREVHPEEKLAAVPDWAVKILQTTIREYRYTGDYVPSGSEEQVMVRIRRGDTDLGAILLTHAMQGEKHYLRLLFRSKDGALEERFTARNLDTFQRWSMFLLERICRYGCGLNRNWCEACSHAERHTQGQFRGVSVPATEAPGGGGPPAAA